MLLKLIKFPFLFLIFLPFYLYPGENASEIEYGSSTPWADFTNFELELVVKLIDYFEHESSFQRFECYYESIKQDIISKLVNPYYDHLETLRSNPKKFNLYRNEIWKMEKALKLDINNVIQMTCTMIESKGIINHKIYKIFNHWIRDTIRLSYPLLKLNFDTNPEKIIKFLKKRLYELHYFIQAYITYKTYPSDKNANIVNFHIEEITALMN